MKSIERELRKQIRQLRKDGLQGSSDRCRFCQKLMGFGDPAFHLKVCEDPACVQKDLQEKEEKGAERFLADLFPPRGQ